MKYANKLYSVVKKFPPNEHYGLSSQLRRAAVSIPNNIAEGSGATTTKDFCRFLDISIRSTLETVNILYVAVLQKYIDNQERKELYESAEKIIRKIRAFKKTIQN